MKKRINFILNNYTLAKIIGGILTGLFVAGLKYYISGNFHIDYAYFFINFNLAFSGWIFNTGLVGILSEYLGIKGINFNLNQLIYGYDTMNEGNGSVKDLKLKLYNAMDIDSDSESSSHKPLDKGKGVDRGMYPRPPYGGDLTMSGGNGLDDKALDKGKEKELPEAPVPTEPHMVTWSKIFPNTDPASVFYPKKINPGPGFNVPGGEVPIRDDICKHIDYNTHILKQFKTMDLETALEQRNNNQFLVRVIDSKLEYARNVLSKIPETPTSDYEFKLKRQIFIDLDSLTKDRARAEARTTLITSRIEFIEDKTSKKD
jgi:hypothetical protein